MAIAYVDSSAIIAIAFDEFGALGLSRRLSEFSEVWSSNLLEAEVRAAYSRNAEAFDPDLLTDISWLFPDRPLTLEISKVVEAGYVKGADLWHLATALYLTPFPEELTFVTLDRRQGEIARALGFRV